MAQAIPRARVEQSLSEGIDSLRAMVENLPYSAEVPKAFHAMISNYQGAVIAEGLTAKHWPALAEIVRTYQRRCREAGLEPWEFPT